MLGSKTNSPLRKTTWDLWSYIIGNNYECVKSVLFVPQGLRETISPHNALDIRMRVDVTEEMHKLENRDQEITKV
jgi:hypothetical protein